MPTIPSSTPSCRPSAPCPPTDAVVVAWRPSRWVVATLWCFGPLGAVSLLASDLPGAFAWPGACLAVVLGWRASAREARRPAAVVAWAPGAPPTLDGRPLAGARLQWRGPLAFLQWREGRRRRALSWWPDTLPPDARRAVRLAADGPVTARRDASMAP